MEVTEKENQITMTTWIAVVIVTMVVVICYYMKRTYSLFAELGIPYAKPMPVLGSNWRSLIRRIPIIEDFYNIFYLSPEAKYIGMYELLRPAVVLRDMELVKSILIKNFDHFRDHRGFGNDETDDMFNKNLLTLRGDRWKETRNLITPVFTSAKVKSMFILMRECVDRYIDILTKLPEEKRILELKDTFTRYTTDVVASCAFGITVDSMADPENKFYVFGREILSFNILQVLKIVLRLLVPKVANLFRIKILRPELEDFFKDLVAKSIQIRKKEGIYRPDLIQLLIEANEKLGKENELTLEDMTANAAIFFSAGLDPVSSAMAFAAFEIGMNQELQEKLQREIDEVMETCNGTVTYDALNEMKYLDAVVNETLRMYPPLIALDRVCTKRFELPPALPGLKPFVLEEGYAVFIFTYTMQRDPKYYEDPNTFNPDRFLDDSKKAQHANVFLSFGIGPRMCIGNRFALLETKVLLFHLLARCNLKPCSKSTTKPIQLSKKTVFLSAENGLWLEIEQRERSQS